MNRVVVDASVLVDALAAPDAEAVQEVVGDRPMAAPAHVDAEVLNALRGLRRGGRLSVPRCAEAAADFADLPLERWAPSLEMLLRALDLAEGMTAYDALYVVLAEALGCPLLTRDLRLARAARPLVAIETA